MDGGGWWWVDRVVLGESVSLGLFEEKKKYAVLSIAAILNEPACLEGPATHLLWPILPSPFLTLACHNPAALRL